ncbi:acyltransferase family protein [Poseidonocella pacifica]|uniref:acyltransferase family protein n=1 Tax=Poseidonocella pacifica TaxID=871651 RepID=UPI000B89F251|nr:acyltransferase family protein [Poseidonocella pacifica]
MLSVAFALLKPFTRGGKVPASVLAGAGVVVTLLQFIRMPTGLEEWFVPAIACAPYFWIGVALGQTDILARLSNSARAAAGFVFCVLLAIWPVIDDYGVGTLGSVILTLCVLAVFSGIAEMERTPVINGLSILGAASMAIYVAHTIISAAVREALLAFGIDRLPPQLILGVAIGILGPLALVWVANRTRTTRLLGL